MFLDLDLYKTKGAGNKKFNINSFINPAKGKHIYTRTSNTDLDPSMFIEMERICRSIDSSYDAFSNKLDREIKEVSNRKNKIQARLETFNTTREPTEVELQFFMALMEASKTIVSIEERKMKAKHDTFKQNRDERKIWFDMNSANLGGGGGSANGGQTTGVSAIDVANAIGNAPAPGISMNPSMFNALNNLRVGAATISNTTEQTPTNVTTSDTQGSDTSSGGTDTFQVATTPPIQGSITQQYTPKDQVIAIDNSLGLITDGTKTLSTQHIENLEIIKKRELAKEDMFKSSTNTLTGKLSTSLNAIQNRSKNIDEVVFVDTQTGKYWVRGFDVNLGEECSTFEPKSIIHLGNIRFDVLTKTAKSPHYDKSIRYELVNGDNGISEFYRNEWEQPSSSQFIVGKDVIDLINA